MRSTIRNILTLFILITIIAKSRGNSELRRGRLSRAYENINRGINDDNIDLDCVKNFFNLPQNNDLMIYDVEEILFDVAADLKCSDGNETFNSIYEKYIHDGWKEQLTCMKWHLQQLEGASKLVENFVINDSELRACKEFPILMELEGFVKRYEETLGSMNVYTCGAVSENAEADFLKFLTKGAVISYGDISEELKKTEMAKLKEYIKDTAVKTASCIMKRYQDDPQAYLVNDTLNYYFKEQSIPTDPNKENVNNFMKRLTKFEESIDNNCAKEKLNLPKYGNKPLLEVEAKIIIASAKSKCIKVDPVEFSELFLDYAIEDGQRANRHFSCARYKLHNIEPTSKLARNYVKDEKNDKFCSRYGFSIHVYSTLFYPYDDYVGKLSTTTCGVLTDEIYDLITLKTTLLFDEKDKDVRVNEAKNLFNFVIDKLQRLADCILERTK